MLFNLKGLLRPFLDSTGLHVNFSKSFLVPINMDNSRASHLANTFGCKVGSMPFTYLGLPLGTTKPSLLDFTPLLSKIERRLSGTSKFLSYHGRLTLVNSVFSALPTFYMCSLKLPPQVINRLKFSEDIVYGAKVTLTGRDLVLLHGRQPVNQRSKEGWP